MYLLQNYKMYHKKINQLTILTYHPTHGIAVDIYQELNSIIETWHFFVLNNMIAVDLGF